MKKSYGILSLLLVLTFTSTITTSCKKLFKRHEKTLTLKIDNNPEIVYTNVHTFKTGDGIIITGSDDDGQVYILMGSDIKEGTYVGIEEITDQGVNINYGSDEREEFNTMVNAANIKFVVNVHDKGDRHIKGYYTLDYANVETQTAHTAKGTFEFWY